MSQTSDSHNKTSQFSWKWLLSRLFPSGMHILTWASYTVILFVLVIFILYPSVSPGPRYYAAIIALSLLFILNAVWRDILDLFEKEENGNWVFLILSSILALFSSWSGQIINSIYIILMITAQINSNISTKPALAFTAILTGSWLGVLILIGVDAFGIASLSGGLIIGLIFVISLSQVLLRYAEQTRRANSLLEQLKAVNAELVAARQREKELAISEERVRVARDLHDGLGHHLTALSIQLQAIEKLVKHDPDMAAEAAHNARSEVQAALKEVRHSVASLRETPIDTNNLPLTIAKLVEDAGKQLGAQARFEQQGEIKLINAATAMTLYRAAQEGLTNIQKHAAGVRQIIVYLITEPGSISLTIEDDGTDPNQLREVSLPGNKGGFGLAGLRERASLLGGYLECGSMPNGGFRLKLSLPNTGETS